MEYTADRNREIYAAFAAGQSIEQLSEIHGLSISRLRAIVVAERHKRIISPEPFYRSLRGVG
jgi:Mor family transcriptional regulator